MSTTQAVVRAVHEIVGRLGEPASDAELLRRFAEQHDEDAFAALVRRYGALVLGVALRVLGRRQDAEDVCQATFLVLARKAGSTVWRESVAGWLYDVACRLARKARRAAERRRERERQGPPRPQPDALADIGLRDLQALLDEELARLPQRLRVVLVLCCLEGRTRDEAAECLGVPLSTVIARLLEGRELLRRRLARRGVPLPSAFAALTLLSPATLSPGLVAATARAALEILAGQAGTGAVSAAVLALIDGGMHTMFPTLLKTTAAVVLATGLLALGALASTSQPTSQPPTPGPPPAAAKAPDPKQAALERALKFARDLDPKETTWPEDKIRLLARIGAAQARAGDREAAGKTFALAHSLVEDVKNDLHKCSALGAIAYHQLEGGDIPAARKTLAVLEAVKAKNDDENVQLNASNSRNGILASIAQVEARAGHVEAALKTAEDLDTAGHRAVVYAAVAREQARRKDVPGALDTVARIDSDLLKTQALADVAGIQEKTDRAGAEKTWRLALASLRKLDFLEPDDLVPGRSRVDFPAVISALAGRGHGDALLQWAEDARSPQVRVQLLLLLAGAR